MTRMLPEKLWASARAQRATVVSRTKRELIAFTVYEMAVSRNLPDVQSREPRRRPCRVQ